MYVAVVRARVYITSLSLSDDGDKKERRHVLKAYLIIPYICMYIMPLSN
jgi:hypothetical protein